MGTKLALSCNTWLLGSSTVAKAPVPQHWLHQMTMPTHREETAQEKLGLACSALYGT